MSSFQTGDNSLHEEYESPRLLSVVTSYTAYPDQMNMSIPARSPIRSPSRSPSRSPLRRPLIQSINYSVNHTMNKSKSGSSSCHCFNFRKGCFTYSALAIIIFILISVVIVSQSLTDMTINKFQLGVMHNAGLWMHSSGDVFQSVRNRWAPYCVDNNFVLDRGDGYNTRRIGDDSTKRIWTMNEQTIDYIDSTRNPSLPVCETWEQLLHSLKYGQRVSINPSLRQSINQTELRDSIFVPDQCTISWMNTKEMCTTLRQFSHVALTGDSLSRHLTQALYLAAREDWRRGALPILSPQSELYSQCQCDGQFSENKVCREFAAEHMYEVSDWRSIGLCYDEIDDTHPPFTVKHHIDQGPNPWAPHNYKYMCNPADPRPRFIHLQGMLHYGADPDRVIQDLIEPFMSHIRNVSAECSTPFQYHVLYTGGHVQSRFLDTVYAHQTRERIVVKNIQLATHMSSQWKLPVIDFWNLTRDAPTSDGLHQLTQVNVVKVMYLLNYMKLILNEKDVNWGL